MSVLRFERSRLGRHQRGKSNTPVTKDGELMREVYQKPTHTNCYVHFDSHNPLSVKSGMVECIANCVITVSSSRPSHEAELKRIKQVMATNGYPKRFVEKAISRQL